MSFRFNTPQSRETMRVILAAAAAPTSVRDLAASTGLAMSTVKQYTRHMLERGEMHIGGRGERGKALLQAGAGENVRFFPQKAKPSYQGSNSALRIRELLVAPMTSSEVSREAKLDASFVRKLIRSMLERDEIHVCGWQDTGFASCKAAVYRAGSESTAGLGGDGEGHDKEPLDPIETQQVRISKATTTGQARRDPFAAMLFGEYQGIAA